MLIENKELHWTAYGISCKVIGEISYIAQLHVGSAQAALYWTDLSLDDLDLVQSVGVSNNDFRLKLDALVL